MDLVDALSSNTSAASPVELSLSPTFHREHPSIFDAIENFFKPKSKSQLQETAQKSEQESQTDAADKSESNAKSQSQETTKNSDPTPSAKAQRRKQEKAMTRLIASTIPPLTKRPFHLTVLDVSPNPRPFAKTLKDLVFTHLPNPIKGNRPVTIGHPYSVLAYLPEKENLSDPKWVVPLSVQRVDSESLETVVGAEQIKNLMANTELPFHKELTVTVADCKYSSRQYVSQFTEPDNLVNIVRSAANRVFYQKPPTQPDDEKKPAHRPTWYGQKFNMKDQDTWPTQTDIAHMTTVTKKEKELTFHIQCWDDMLMRGKNGIDMHNRPFRLLRVICVDDEGNTVFKRPMWLLVFGKRRNKLSLVEIVDAYQQRYDIEHFFRFGKQKLLLTAAQTPIVENEENWWDIVMLAYVQLWTARRLAQHAPRPWERYQQPKSASVATPSATQRDFDRLIQQFGTPAKSPKPRGNSKGRQKGDKQTPRTRQPVIKKTKKSTSSP